MTSLIPPGDLRHLRRSGSHLVAGVYALSGCRVSWPLEPSPYDLLVEDPLGGLHRVQVKTCTTQQGGSWICWITRSEYCDAAGGKRRVRYQASDVDVLAVVDGDLAVYLIPFERVVGQASITLRAYADYRVGSLAMPGMTAQA